MSRRLLHLLTAAAVAAGAVAGPAAGPLGDAHASSAVGASSGAVQRTRAADVDTTHVSVRVEEVRPAVVRPDQDVQVRVTVSSTSEDPTGPLELRALTGSGALGSRAALTSWLHDPQPRAQANQVATSQTLAAGLPGKGSTTVALSLPRARVARPSPFGAYPLAVEVRSGTERLDLARTVLPWVASTPEYEPLRLAWVAPLTLPADPALTTGTSSQVGTAWSKALAPDGPLLGRLDAAGDTPVTWLVDPAVLTPPTRTGGLVSTTPSGTATPAASSSTASTSSAPSASASASASSPTTGATTGSAATSRAGASGGASVPASATGAATSGPAGGSASGTGTAPASHTPSPPPTTPGEEPGAAALATADTYAQRLGEQLKGLPDHQPIWALPTGDPDTAALLSAAPGPDLRSLLWPSGGTALDKAVGRTLTSSIAWPADGLWTADRTDAWSSLTGRQRPTAALVSTTSVTAGRGTTPGAAQVSADGLPLLAYDADLSRVAGGSADSSEGEVVQEFLGQSLTLLGELPGTRRTALVAIPRGTTLSPAGLRRLWGATGSAPWLEQVDATTILGEGAPSVASGAAPAAGTTPLSGTTVAALGDDLATVAGLRRILPADHPAAASWSSGVRDLASTRWRDRPDAWITLRKDVTRSLDGTRQGIQVRPSTINFLADTGTIQITVTNSLPYPVHDVRLSVVPGSPRLRVEQGSKALSIAAGSRTTTQVQVTALGAGTVPLETQLTTPDGVVLGSPSAVDMNVRPTSVWVFALIAGIVGAILVLGLARSLRRGPTRAQRELGDTRAVADAVLGPDTSAKDPT